MKINEAAKMTGVTIRTLHYYDQIGLLRPETVTDAGYRLYGEKDMERLSQILFFRELDFPLSQIKEMLDSPSFDRNEALRAQHELLKKKKERLERLIALTERRMEGEKEMSFQEFDSSEIERCKEKYAEEAKERWGHTQAWQESKKRTGGSRQRCCQDNPSFFEKTEGKTLSVHALLPEFFFSHYLLSSSDSDFIAVICVDSTPSVLSALKRIFSVSSISLISSHTV